MKIALPIYLLCAITSATVAVILFQNYRRTGVRFLLWSALCFGCFFLNNTLLFFDMIVFVNSVDLSVIRTIPVVAGFGLLIYGLVWDVT